VVEHARAFISSSSSSSSPAASFRKVQILSRDAQKRDISFSESYSLSLSACVATTQRSNEKQREREQRERGILLLYRLSTGGGAFLRGTKETKSLLKDIIFLGFRVLGFGFSCYSTTARCFWNYES